MPTGLEGNVIDYVFDRSHADIQDKICLIADGVPHRYRDLADHIDRAAQMLRDLGVKPGERVMLCLRDGLAFPALFFGAIKIGVIPVPLNTYLRPSDYIYYLNDSAARVLVAESDILKDIAAAKDELTHAPILVSANGVLPDCLLLHALTASPVAPIATVGRQPDSPAFWLYSSGSTGSPKGVVHTHNHLYWACELFGLPMQGIGRDDVILCPPKMFFAYDLGNQVYFPFKAGATTICTTAPIRPETVWQQWLDNRPTLFMGVPTLFAGMLSYAEEHLTDDQVKEACAATRFCVSGGEVLPPTLLAKWRDLTGLDILDGVGTTEMTHMFIINRPGKVVPGSCGQPVPGFKIQLLDEAGAEVPCGEIGSLFATGPTAATEYWNKPEKTADTMRSGGVFTGDKYYADDDGNLFYVGRGDDMLRIGAIWVSPAEIENVIAEHGAVIECAVVGAPNEEGLIRPIAYVVLRGSVADHADDLQALSDEIKTHVKTKLPRFKCPHSIEFVEDLPKTATGKIQRFRLRNRVESYANA